MSKKLIYFLIILTLLFPSAAFADNGSTALTEYSLASDMQISLPDGWYFNTPRDIDKDFLKVSENSRNKLMKYLTNNDIDYNLVSKDLLQEINVIFVNSSQTKIMYDFNLLGEDVLLEKAQALIDMETEAEDGVKTTYQTYRLEKISGCTFMVFEGIMESETDTTQFYQYTTMVNGYSITCTYRGNEGADHEQGKLLLDEIAHTFRVDEIKEANVRKNLISQMIAPAVIIGGFFLFTVFLFIRQLIKNKKEEAAEKAGKSA